MQDPRGLARLLEDLDRQTEVAVDTEADSFFSYRDKVCLIQITAESRDYLVDPLAGFDLAPLGRVFADETKTKVFHDGEYDVLILKRDYGFRFKRLFDTRVAAATLGSASPGLASVLRDYFSIELDKSMQRSNWGQRPLSDKQIRYARLDTHFLLDLMRHQRPELERHGRAMIVDGECQRLEQLLPSETVFDPDDYIKIKGARALPPLGRQTLRELFVLRESIACAEDQPPFRILNNETLIEIAQTLPKNQGELGRVRGFSPRQGRLLGDAVLRAVARARELGALQTIKEPRGRDGTDEFDEEEVELHERLKRWRKGVSAEMNVDAAYLVNRHALLRLSRERPRDRDALARIEGLHAWQVERFSKDILQVLERFERDRAEGKLPVSKRRFRKRER
ncbi:MAG: ribonuclease D [Planctomycetota bacterium]